MTVYERREKTLNMLKEKNITIDGIEMNEFLSKIYGSDLIRLYDMLENNKSNKEICMMINTINYESFVGWN